MQESEAFRRSGLDPSDWEVISRTRFYLFIKESEAFRRSGLDPSDWEVISRTRFYLFIKEKCRNPAEIRMIPRREIELVSIRKSA